MYIQIEMCCFVLKNISNVQHVSCVFNSLDYLPLKLRILGRKQDYVFNRSFAKSQKHCDNLLEEINICNMQSDYVFVEEYLFIKMFTCIHEYCCQFLQSWLNIEKERFQIQQCICSIFFKKIHFMWTVFGWNMLFYHLSVFPQYKPKRHLSFKP